MTSPAGGPFNEVLLVPERYATLRPAAVPVEDRPWIEKVLGASWDSGRDDGPEATLARPEDIDAAAPTRQFGPDAYRARIDVVERDLRMEVGQERALLVRVVEPAWRHGPGKSITRYRSASRITGARATGRSSCWTD